MYHIMLYYYYSIVLITLLYIFFFIIFKIRVFLYFTQIRYYRKKMLIILPIFFSNYINFSFDYRMSYSVINIFNYSKIVFDILICKIISFYNMLNLSIRKYNTRYLFKFFYKHYIFKYNKRKVPSLK